MAHLGHSHNGNSSPHHDHPLFAFILHLREFFAAIILVGRLEKI